MPKVEWMDPPDGRFRTELNLDFAAELLENPGRWAVIERFEDQRKGYQLRVNVLNRLERQYPGMGFEGICRRQETDDTMVTCVFIRHTGPLGTPEHIEEDPEPSGD